jgi:hypothetical protein
MLAWDWYRFNKKCTVTRYVELVCLHSVGSVGHVVHSGVSGMPNADALFFMLGGVFSEKITLGHITPKLCFCIWWHMRVT